MKIFDLSVPTESGPSEPLPVLVEYESHQQSAPFMASFFGARVEDLPEGNGWANDKVTMSSHAGTHVDAPCTTTRPAAASAPVPLMRCPWSGSLAVGWCWTCAISLVAG